MSNWGDAWPSKLGEPMADDVAANIGESTWYEGGDDSISCCAMSITSGACDGPAWDISASNWSIISSISFNCASSDIGFSAIATWAFCWAMRQSVKIKKIPEIGSLGGILFEDDRSTLKLTRILCHIRCKLFALNFVYTPIDLLMHFGAIAYRFASRTPTQSVRLTAHLAARVIPRHCSRFFRLRHQFVCLCVWVYARRRCLFVLVPDAPNAAQRCVCLCAE